jgi:hypothetical protein
MNVREACKAVVKASPSDYEAACEAWTRVCTPQAVLAALPAGTCSTCHWWDAGTKKRSPNCLRMDGVVVEADDYCSFGYDPKEDATP